LKKNAAVLTALIMGLAVSGFSQAPAAAPAGAPTKIGIVNMMLGIQQTKEGQKAIEALTAKMAPKRDAIEKKQADIQSKRDQLSKGAATLSAEAKAKLNADIDTLTKSANRDIEDFQAEANDEESKITQELGSKMLDIVTKFGADNGYAVLLDVSSQQTPVLWAASGTEITNQVIALYDAKYPSTGSAAPAPAAPPATKKK
jgi:outer membrane protein